MAAKRISGSTINWAAIAERVPESQRATFTAFKSRSDVYLRRVLANPPEPPKIDWALYKNVVPVAGMVDNFQKQYASLKVPAPTDTLTAQVEAQWQSIQKEIEAFCKDSDTNIADYQKKIEEIKAMLPFDQMTMEDVYDAFPGQALDPLNNPTFWPHIPEDQPGYEGEKPAETQAH